ncbi:hypothetical protein [Spirosoma fluminis]
MKLLLETGFDLLIALDKGFEHQQNFVKYPIPVLVLWVNYSDYEFLLPLVEKVRQVWQVSFLKGLLLFPLTNQHQFSLIKTPNQAFFCFFAVRTYFY